MERGYGTRWGGLTLRESRRVGLRQQFIFFGLHSKDLIERRETMIRTLFRCVVVLYLVHTHELPIIGPNCGDACMVGL